MNDKVLENTKSLIEINKSIPQKLMGLTNISLQRNEMIKPILLEINNMTIENINKITSPSQNFGMRYREIINSMRIDTNLITSNMGQIYNTLGSSSKILATLMKEMNTSKMSQLYNSTGNSSKILGTLINEMNTSNMNQFYNSIGNTAKILQAAIYQFNNINFNNFNLNGYSDEVIDEAKAFVIDTFQEVDDSQNEENLKITENINWQQNVKDKWDKYAKKNPVYSLILGVLLTFIISNYMIKPMFDGAGAIIREQFSKIDTSNYGIKNAKKDVYTGINTNYYYIQDLVFAHYRYINKNKVFIRKDHSMNSSIVVEVNKGDVIELATNLYNKSKKRYKNWLYVEYTDENGENYGGWINNIYTGNIK